MCQIGHIDIAMEVLLLSLHPVYPCKGHLDAALHVMGYLKLKCNSQLIFYLTYPHIDGSLFQHLNLKEFYGDFQEAILMNALLPLGKEVDLCMMVDSNHAGEKLTWCLQTEFLIFLNMSLIKWLSQKQPTIESSVFGAGFVAIKLGMDALQGIWYKLCMMVVPIARPTYIYGDNMPIIHNTQWPESTLKKKNLSICYHTVREVVVFGEILMPHVWTKNNYADFMTKVTYGQKRQHLVGSVMFDIYDDHSNKKSRLAENTAEWCSCLISKLVLSKSNLLHQINLRGLRKLG